MFIANCRPLLLAFSLLLAGTGWAAGAKPATDAAYPGTLTLQVDLTDAARKIFSVRESIPVKAGPLNLAYPKWIPGEHGPTGPIESVTGLKIFANGQRVAWRRDLEDMFLLHLEVPAGATRLDLEFQVLSATGGGMFGTGVSASPRLLMLEWNQALLYPADYATARVEIVPSVKLPAGWSFATAMEKVGEADGGTRFKALSVDELVDSPLLAGQHFRRIDLAPGTTPTVHLNLAADRPDNLELSEAQIEHHRALVKQAIALYGAQHYDHYDFLLALSERTNHFGLEHHQSSDDRAAAEFFTSKTAYLAGPTLLPHEYTHSWNGKFRRPAGLTTANFGAPMKGDLLWVYEGLTNYLGEVLAARSGMWSAEQYRDSLAMTAAAMDHIPGRAWRPLRDTADQAQVLYNAPGAWSNYRRGVDFYPEGSLLWLEVDTRIRELSQGKKSLDDYIRIFYGKDPAFAKTSHDVKPYDFAEVVKTLNAVQPYDWAALLRQRLDATSERAPLEGLARGGWKLVYTDTPTEVFKAAQKENKRVDLMYSLGIIAGAETFHGVDKGEVIDVLWNGPAFEAGLAPSMKIVAVDGEAFDADLLTAAVARAQKDKKPIELLVQNQDYYSTLRVQYGEGLKYPRLVRLDGSADRITPIVTAK
ncbi:MAG: M61 family metallopeptidase [Betaproteobacteria bacterium]|nr:M61 family metallopeptidase [Betaproteobacteria bacterium]